MTTHTIGTNLRKKRLEKGYTNARRFAEQNGLNRTNYLKLEQGQDMRISTLLKVSEALKINPVELFA